jgi:hypothetical protein
VLQPPEIRHRVLRSSPGLEVIEIGCPAVHDTVVEHDITLPTSTVDVHRRFGGQQFVHHIARDAAVRTSILDGFSERDTGIEAATGGLAGARVLSARGAGGDAQMLEHDGEFAMAVVLAGTATLVVDAGRNGSADAGSPAGPVRERDAVAVPAGVRWGWSNWSSDFEILDVTLPARTVSAS